MITKRKADLEESEAERKADREVATRLEAVYDKTDANQMRVEPETEHQERIDAGIANMKDGRKERTACQEATEANPEKMEPIDRAIAMTKPNKKDKNLVPSYHTIFQNSTSIRSSNINVALT
jgi:hypothetical protein